MKNKIANQKLVIRGEKLRFLGLGLRWGIRSFANFAFWIGDLPERIKYFFGHISTSRKKIPEVPIAEKHVLLLALFQSSSMRVDIQNLIQLASELDFVIFVSNNGKLKEIPRVSFYEERSNYGRDFGSYKSLTQVFFAQKDFEQVKSVTFLNDSVFYMPNRSKDLLGKVGQTGEQAAFGITDNHYESYHLASYFVNVANSVLRHREFRDFWSSYKLTNSRPKIIKKGEMKLSKVIWSIAGKNNLESIYNHSSLVVNVAKINEGHLLSKDKDRLLREMQFLEESNISKKVVRYQIYRSMILRLLSAGAPAHGCIKPFLEEGMPVIKLDIHYRGIADYTDIAEIENYIEDDRSRDSFRRAVLGRGQGARDLTGLNKIYFSYGLI